jgi:Mn2+/Fe2+ NRAMP family transporter
MGFSWKALFFGMIPNVPEKVSTYAADPADTILSLVGTTAIGFNLFLGGSMAEGRELMAARRGIAFSTTIAFITSALILLVGSGAFRADSVTGTSSQFSIEMLAEAIHGFLGTGGVAVFSCGFIAAAFSSMLTVALGAYLAAKSLLIDQPHTPDEASSPRIETRTRWAWWAIVTSIILIATGVVSSNLPRKTIILVAQVFNGMLLPVFSMCLLLCINDLQFMTAAPQGLGANALLLPSVAITLFLAMRVAVQRLFLVFGTDGPRAKEWLTLFLCALVIVAVACMTSLWSDLRRSLVESYKRQEPGNGTKCTGKSLGKAEASLEVNGDPQGGAIGTSQGGEGSCGPEGATV